MAAVAGFAIRLLLVFSVLLALWPVAGERFGRAFRAAGNVLVGDSRSVWYAAPERPSEAHDVRLEVSDERAHRKRTTELSSRRHAYLPLAFFTAFVIGVPVSWRRRLGALLVGTPCVMAYLALKLALFPAAYGLDEAAMTGEALRRILWVVSASSVGWMLPPLLIGVLVLFPPGRWSPIFQKPAEGAGPR